jgi:hypothetical protein
VKLTHRLFHHAAAFLLVALPYHQNCLAPVDPWQRVKTIEHRKSVQVKLRSGKTVKGKMESWSAEGISVRRDNDRVITLAKSDVARVAMLTGMSRNKKGAYGMLIGGVAGGVVMGKACASMSDCDVSPSGMGIGGALLFGSIGCVIGALLPEHKEIIYTAESAPLRGGASDSRAMGIAQASE